MWKTYSISLFFFIMKKSYIATIHYYNLILAEILRKSSTYIKIFWWGRSFPELVSRSMWTSEGGRSSGEASTQRRWQRMRTPQRADTPVPFVLCGFRAGFVDKVPKSSYLLYTQAFSVINKLVLFCTIL